MDPLFNHARYCTLSKQTRASIVADLSSVAADIFYRYNVRVRNICKLISWESIIVAIPTLETQNIFYTMLLDAGVSFTDGSDGVLWGTSKGLSYHNRPVSEISTERQEKTYISRQLRLFEQRFTAESPEKRAFLAQLTHQLRRIETRIATQTSTKKHTDHKRRTK